MNTTLNLKPIGSDIEGFLASGERIWRKQREKLQAEERQYQQDRFQLEQDYSRRAQALMTEREDTLRSLEAKYARTKAEGERMLRALAHLREG